MRATAREQDGQPDPFEIPVEGGLADDRTLVAMWGDTFGMFDRLGDILPPPRGRHGLFHEGTRYLSRFQLALWRTRPALLSSSVREEDGMLVVHLTNPDIRNEGAWSMVHHSVHRLRRMWLEDGRCRMELAFRSYGREPLVLPLDILVDADFADIFEVRGALREQRGRLLAPEVDAESLSLRYRGLDEVERVTRIAYSLPPISAGPSLLRFRLDLDPDSDRTLSFTVECRATEPGR